MSDRLKRDRRVKKAYIKARDCGCSRCKPSLATKRLLWASERRKEGLEELYAPDSDHKKEAI